HWVTTLSQSPLITNGEFTTLKMLELAEKINIFSKDAKRNVSSGQIIRESDAIAEEVSQGYASNMIKRRLFGGT
ncbi:COP9 signalosome catalytic subunit rri1, partial [Coemansia sp. S610]